MVKRNELQSCWKCGGFISDWCLRGKHDRIQTNHVNIQQANMEYNIYKK